MLNKLLFICLLLFFIYVAVFIVYFTIIVIVAFKKSKKKSDNELKTDYKNIIVAVYSHNNENNIVNLLEQLNKQEYPRGNYQTHIILDNCTDDSSNKLEFVGGAKLWRLTDDTPLGKDKSLSWLLENLLSFKQVDAYVFLGADRMITSDFLLKVNEALKENDVIVGSTEIYRENADFTDKIWCSVNDYNSDIIKSGRSKLGLAVPIDSDITVIKHEVLEKVKCIDFKDANSELKYSFLLTSVNYPPKFVKEVKTYISSMFYTPKRPDFKFKVSLFFHCFKPKSLMNPIFAEFLFSLLKPNPLILLAILTLIGTYSFNYYFLFDFPWAVFLAVVLIIAFGLSVYKSHIYFKPLIYLMFVPFYTLAQTLSKMTLLNKIVRFRKKKQSADTELISVPVAVTNGRSTFSCTLDLISEDGFKKAVFRYKKKKQETMQGYVRMCDAVKNISDILEQHGFRIKICQSCAYFSPKIDGTNNMVKGYCNKIALDNPNCVEAPETLLWSSCEYFIPQEVNNVIDISSYIKNR